MATNYWDITDRDTESLRSILVEWGSRDSVENLDGLVTAWRRLVTTEDLGSGRAEQLERDLAAANKTIAEWKERYREDVVKLSNEKREALNQVVLAERDAAAARRELAERPEVAEDGELTREERQFTAQLRVLIDGRLGKRTPQRIRDIAEGNFPEDRTEEEEEEYRQSRRSHRRGRGRRSRRGYNNRDNSSSQSDDSHDGWFIP